MAAVIFSITPEGLATSLDAANTGLGLQLTHVSGHNAAGVEIGRWPLSGGIVEPNSNTLRFSSVMTSTSRKELYGLKLLADSLVFATSVGASPLVVVDANIDFAPAFGLALGQIPVGSITVSTDPNAALAIILMLQHVGAANPHPQYAMDAQNNLEHANLLLLIQQLNLALATAEENIMDMQTIQNIQSTLDLMNQRLTVLEAKRERPLPIGTVIETTKPATFTAQNWAEEFGYNSIWVEDVQSAGRVIVGAGEVNINYSSATGDAARANVSRTFTVGETGGELDHKLTLDEMPEVTIDIPFGQRGGFWESGNALHPRGTGTTTDTTVEAILQGGETPLNLLQPFLVRKKFVLTGYQTSN